MNSTSSQPQPSPLALGEILYLLFRHKWKITTCAALGIAAALTIYVITPRVYRSNAKLLVRYVSERTLVAPDATGERVISPNQRGQNVINSELEIIRSHGLAADVATLVGPEAVVAETLKQHPLARLRQSLKRVLGRNRGHQWSAEEARRLAPSLILRNLRIEVPRDSSVIRLSYDGPLPDLSQRVLDTLVTKYLQKHQEVHSGGDAYGFLTQQTEQMKARLQQTERELHQIKADLGIDDLTAARQQLVERRQGLQEAIWQAEAELAAGVARTDVIRRALPETAAADTIATVTNRVIALGSVQDRLRRLREKELELLEVFTEDSSLIQSVREQIRNLERLLGEQPSSPQPSLPLRSGSKSLADALEGTLVTEEAQSAALKARIWALRNHLEMARADLKRIDEGENRIAELTRRKELEEANYRYFAQSLERARIDDALEADKISNINVVQSATYPAQSQRPDMVRRMLIALLLGCGAGLGLAFATEHALDTYARRPADLCRAGSAPALTVPFSPPALKRGLRSGKTKGTHQLVAQGSQTGIPCRLDPDLRPFWEGLRDIVLDRIGPASTGPDMIGVAGCTAGSGATTVAAGLAVCLASERTRVLLVNAAAGHAVTASLEQDRPQACRLVDAAQGRDVAVKGLDILTCTPDRASPAMSIGPNEALLSPDLRNEYSYIVYDLPPVKDASPTIRVARSLASLVLVVAAGRTPLESIRHAGQLLNRALPSGPVVVLNRRRFYVPKWIQARG